jgi:hypothetical protein
MKKLESLYSSSKLSSDNPLCQGCSILEQNKPAHSLVESESLKECSTLFISDSLKYRYGSVTAFSKKELEIIKECFPFSFVTAASVKCPSVKEADMSPTNMKLCRVHLENTVKKVRPRVIFACGNLAMKMLIKKSGITNKRGKAFPYETEDGFSCIVVPVYHPFAVIAEPRHKELFKKDLQNGYEKYVLEKRENSNFSYKILTDIEDVRALASKLENSEETIAADLETTGLNFLKDTIMTVAISTREQTWVIPVDHKDSPHKGDLRMYKALHRIFENPKNKKVFHNAKFDLKFLINYGIYPKNVWDTKIMHHILDENMPKSLMDLVKLYFANELEDL